MNPEKEIFKRGLAQLREEGYVPVPPDKQQVQNNTNNPAANDFIAKMAGRWKQVTAVTEAKDVGIAPPRQQNHSIPPPPQQLRAATMDIPYGVSTSPSYVDEGFGGAVDPREDDAYFERMQMEKMQAFRNKQPKMQPKAQPLQEYAQPQQPAYQQPLQYAQPQQGILNEERVAQVAETVLKDVVLNMYIEEKIRKVLSEGLSDDRIRQVVKQTIKELTEYNKSKK